MGFECRFQYHERLEGGGYDKENTKEMTRKVGEPFDDTPLEKLVSVIMAQLARRDIWVVGVFPVEYSRKEITFRETDGGIVLKNKKFTFDQQCDNITCQDIPVQVQSQQLVAQHPHEALRQQQRPAAVQVHEQPPNRNLAYPTASQQRRQKRVVFAPSDVEQLKRQKVYGFTVEREYTVLSERMNSSGVGLTLIILDDMGRQQEVSDEFFIPTTSDLYADKQLGFSKPPPGRDGGGNLDWHGVINDEIPDVRGRM